MLATMTHARLSYDEVQDRIDHIVQSHRLMDRRRIRAVMNGGPEGVQAVLGWDADGPAGDMRDMGADLPTANLMWSGLERLSQKVGRMPTLKTDMIPIRDTKKARSAADKRARIVQGWDDNQRIELQYPQIGRWLPGYGFVAHVIRERMYAGDPYPVAELRDPYDCYPGWFGPDQQPEEMAVVRRISYRDLYRIYPHAKAVSPRPNRQSSGVVILGSGNWEGATGLGTDTTEIVEYIENDNGGNVADRSSISR